MSIYDHLEFKHFKSIVAIAEEGTYDPKDVKGAAALSDPAPAKPQIDLDHDPEPAASNVAKPSKEPPEPTEEELAASADPDVLEDKSNGEEDDLQDEEPQLAQPSFHFDRA